MTQEALKLALEVNESMKDVLKQVNKLIAENKALKEALAQPEQEPVCPDCKAKVLYECVACSSNNYPPKTKQEPVAHWSDCAVHSEPAYPKGECDCGGFATPPQRTDQNFCSRCGKRTKDIHTCTPPQRTFVGLTEQERNDIEDYCEMMIGKPAFDAIEAKLKQANGFAEENT